MPFLRQRQLDDLIEAIDHNSTVLADLIDVINRTAGLRERELPPPIRLRTRTGGWIPEVETALGRMAPEDVTAAREEALSIVDEVHRAQDGNDDQPLIDDDTPKGECA